MFSDIASLVHSQSEELDNIETNLNGAKNYIEKAVEVLVKAKEQHQKTRKVIKFKKYLEIIFIIHLEDVLCFNHWFGFACHYRDSNYFKANESNIIKRLRNFSNF